MVIRNVMALSSLVLFIACGAAPEPETSAQSALATSSDERGVGRGPVEVMTRNLYLGAALDDVIAAGSLPAFLAATTRVWNTVVANDFHARAELLADEIAMNRPDAVGLQEAFLWRTQSPSDPATPATHVVYDYIAELLAALEARGTPYEVAESIELLDIETPTLMGIDVRATDRQAILVRKGTEFRNARGARYSVLLPLQILGSPFLVPRGWTAVDLKIGGEWLAFLNTHTESFFAPVRVLQGMELAGILAATPGKAVLVGDLNSLPGTEVAASVAGVGFTDSWADVHPKKDGFTCCFPERLTETEPGRDQRIDYVFVRDLKPLTGKIVGARPFDHRTGLWPSDHAGLVTTAKPEQGMWAHAAK
ncbi:MAG: endonuclease [Myxococcaceae bacterium]|nr:MAG: endonuclease [Myxococcaceae bacterium]